MVYFDTLKLVRPIKYFQLYLQKEPYPHTLQQLDTVNGNNYTSSLINWTKVVKKEVRGLKDACDGDVQDVQQGVYDCQSWCSCKV